MSELERKPRDRWEALELAFLRRAPRSLVELVAGRLARAKPLRREPGWHFDAGADDPSRVTRFRRDLWHYYRERGIERPVALRWYDGLRVRTFLGNDMSLCLYVGGSFEPNEFYFLDEILAPGMTVVDGGANDGIYSLFASRRVGPTGRVLAIEPSSRELARLRANLARNRADNVTVLQVALGRERGTAQLAVAEPGHEGQNTIGPRVSNPKVATASHEDVELTTLDALVDAHALERVDVIKLDVEGSEVEAILGGLETLRRYRPLLLLEVETERLASQDRTKDDVRRLLGDLGYELFVFDLGSGEPRAAVGPDEPEGNALAAFRDDPRVQPALAAATSSSAQSSSP